MWDLKVSRNEKPHHNKWLLYSCTLVLVCFLFSVVECGNGIQSLTVLDKVKDKTVSSNRKPSPERNSVSGNDLDHPFSFNAMDEEDASLHDQEDDEDDEDDEDSAYSYDSFEEVHNEDDANFIKEHDKEEPHVLQEPARLAKCCDIGQGLTLRGSCAKISDKLVVGSSESWFPKKVYDGHTQQMVDTNSSEWVTSERVHIKCNEGERPEVIHDSKRFTLLKDGSLYVFDHNKLIHPMNFCIDLELGKGQGRVVKACFTKSELCDDEQCIRKCCPVGSFSEIFEAGDIRCVQSHLAHFEKYSFKEKKILPSNPTCNDGTRLEPVDPHKYNITSNGTLQTPIFTAPLLSYCLDYFIDKSKPQSPGDHHHVTPALTAMVCFDGLYSGVDARGLIVVPYSIGVLFGIAMIISTISLAVAAAISWRLPELRSLHGKCQLSHLITMFFLYLCLAIVQLGTMHLPQGLCTFLGIFIHICSLSSFLWLNLLCVNIYLTFRSLRPPLAARRDENKRLFFLCIYAWGIPAAFCMFLYILDSSGRLHPMPAPEYGELKCLISNREAEFAYLFGPVGVLLLFNGLLFCLTAQELLCGVWRLDNSDSINFRRKSMGIVVAKLGIVMGMGWILDVLSWAFGKESHTMFYAADLFNACQGVFISVILLWRKRVLEVLHLRRPSITKDDTITATRPFIPKNGSVNTVSHADHDTSLVIVQEA